MQSTFKIRKTKALRKFECNKLTWVLQHSSVDEPEALAGIHRGPIDRHNVFRTRVELIERKVGIGLQLGARV